MMQQVDPDGEQSGDDWQLSQLGLAEKPGQSVLTMQLRPAEPVTRSLAPAV